MKGSSKRACCTHFPWVIGIEKNPSKLLLVRDSCHVNAEDFWLKSAGVEAAFEVSSASLVHRKPQTEHAGQTTCLGESTRVGEVSEGLASEMIKENTHISSDTCAVGRALTLIISKDLPSVPPWKPDYGGDCHYIRNKMQLTSRCPCGPDPGEDRWGNRWWHHTICLFLCFFN